MIVLTGSKTLTAVLSGAPATTQPNFIVVYADSTATTFSEDGNEIVANGATPVTLLTAPPVGTSRNVKNIYCFNRDTAPTVATVSVNGAPGLSAPIAAGACVDLCNPAGATSVFTAIASQTLLGNNSGSSAAPSALTKAQVLTILGLLDHSSRISITSGVTATLNRVHEIDLATAATVLLPTAVGNAGAFIELKVKDTNVATVTVDGNASETIDGSLTLTMHKNGVLWIYSDGTNWRSIIRNRAPGIYVEASDASGQVCTGGTTNLQYATEAFDTHNSWSGSVFTAQVEGKYNYSASVLITAANVWMTTYKNGVLTKVLGVPSPSTDRNQTSGTIYLSVGDTLSFRLQSTSTRTAVSDGNGLTISGQIE